MRSRPIHVPFAAGVASAAFLVACSTPGNYRNDASHEQLLQSLRQCLVEIPIRGEKNKEFVSPCITMDVSPLNGIPRSRLIDALGPAQFCTGENKESSSFPTTEDCPFEQNPQWSFYRHVDATLGGGPELICEANSHLYCVTLEWRRSQ
jgi:hypothetical protein